MLKSVTYSGTKRFLILQQGDRLIEVTLWDRAAERTDETILGHLVEIGPLTIVSF
jgi:hypothetical protein